VTILQSINTLVNIMQKAFEPHDGDNFFQAGAKKIAAGAFFIATGISFETFKIVLLSVAAGYAILMAGIVIVDSMAGYLQNRTSLWDTDIIISDADFENLITEIGNTYTAIEWVLAGMETASVAASIAAATISKGGLLYPALISVITTSIGWVVVWKKAEENFKRARQYVVNAEKAFDEG
jgi:hypothetical protein